MMSTKSLADISAIMQGIDFAMLSTKTDGGAIASRPMSTNRDVEYDGDSFFFTSDETRMVSDIEKDPSVSLTFAGKKGLLPKAPLFVAVEGKAELIRDKAAFKEHWQPDLDKWFEQGVDTPGLILIKVHANRISYWDGEEHGEIRVANAAPELTPRLDRDNPPLATSRTMQGAGTSLSDI